MSHLRKRLVTSMMCMGVIILMASGCGSGTSASPAASTTSVDSPGAKAAAAYLAKFTTNPTSIGLDKPLKTKPQSGKSVITLTVPLGSSQRLAKAESAAAEALGWKFSSVNAGATPATAVSAFEAALAKTPDAITYSGYPASLFATQIKDAKARGIAVISDSTGDKAVDGVLADLDGTDQLAAWGRISAAYFVAHAGDKGAAAIFSVNAYPVLAGFVDGFQEGVKEWCPSCTTDVVNQQVTDPGSKTPVNVVSYLQRNPKVKWAVFSNGGFAQGVDTAVKTAGLRDIKIIGQVPTPANLANVSKGTEAAWAGVSLDILGWRVVDVLARHFEGSDVAEAAAMSLPNQIITTENVSSIISDGGYFVGVDGYQDQFAALWKIR